MAGFFIRMQPCEGRPGMRPGSLVPCTPITPPPGQSVRVFEYAAVPIARVPYIGLPETWNFSRIQNEPVGVGVLGAPIPRRARKRLLPRSYSVMLSFRWLTTSRVWMRWNGRASRGAPSRSRC